MALKCYFVRYSLTQMLLILGIQPSLIWDHPPDKESGATNGKLLVSLLAGITLNNSAVFLGVAFDFDGIWVFYCFGVGFYFGAIFLGIAFDLYFLGIGGVYEKDRSGKGESQKFIHAFLLG